jgi:hypothetical protein
MRKRDDTENALATTPEPEPEDDEVEEELVLVEDDTEADVVDDIDCWMNFSKVLWQSKVAAQKSLSLATTIPLE